MGDKKTIYINIFVKKEKSNKKSFNKVVVCLQLSTELELKSKRNWHSFGLLTLTLG